MIVMKFGGTSVGNADMIRNVASIVKSKGGRNPIVVVSALSGITDSLIALANSAVNGGNADSILDTIIRRHYETIGALGLDNDAIENEVRQLRTIADGIRMIKELTPKTMDNVMSFGERMSSRIVAGYMSTLGMGARAFDSYDLGLVTDSNYGDADALPSAYKTMHKKLAACRCIPVITGFIGKDKSGNITTLGRGGSDYTASIMGAAANAEEIQIWTDVNGIMTADPRVVKAAKSIAMVSYAEASELAFLGAKVLHPKTILPAINKNIPVRILNTFNPTHKGTIVVRDIHVKNRVASIACKKNIQVINITTPNMFQSHGFMRKVFEIFDKHNVSVDMVSTSEVSISITLDGKQKTGALVEDLSKLAHIDVMANRAKVSIVGKGVVYLPRILVRLFSSLEGIYIEMISSSTSEVNDGFVVEEKYADEAVRRLHKTFFGR